MTKEEAAILKQLCTNAGMLNALMMEVATLSASVGNLDPNEIYKDMNQKAQKSSDLIFEQVLKDYDSTL